MSVHTFLRCVFALSFALLVAPPAHAQLFRAYLASDGNDANPCTLAQPCRLLPAAITAVASGGEIWMLDSGNYNTAPVSITKSVTILAVPGALGSVVANGGNAININNIVEVALRNLVIVPLPGGGGTNGILLTASGAALTVENCLIANLPMHGISASNAVTLRITDSTIRGNGSDGLYLVGGPRTTITRATISRNAGHAVLAYGSGNTTTADITSSTIDGNGNSAVVAQSVTASGVVKVSVRDSLVTGNNGTGLFSLSQAGASVTFSASHNTVSNNGDGISSSGTGAKVWANANTVSENTFNGLTNTSGGVFESAGNNAVRNNGTNKTGTITVVVTE